MFRRRRRSCGYAAEGVLLQWPPKSQASSSILGPQLFFQSLANEMNHNIIYTL